MGKLLLMASMVMTIVLPIRAARFENPRYALKRAVWTTLLFNTAWAAVVMALFMFLLRDPEALKPDVVQP